MRLAIVVLAAGIAGPAVVALPLQTKSAVGGDFAIVPRSSSSSSSRQRSATPHPGPNASDPQNPRQNVGGDATHRRTPDSTSQLATAGQPMEQNRRTDGSETTPSQAELGSGVASRTTSPGSHASQQPQEPRNSSQSLDLTADRANTLNREPPNGTPEGQPVRYVQMPPETQEFLRDYNYAIAHGHFSHRDGGGGGPAPGPA